MSWPLKVNARPRKVDRFVLNSKGDYGVAVSVRAGRPIDSDAKCAGGDAHILGHPLLRIQLECDGYSITMSVDVGFARYISQVELWEICS